MLRFPGLIPPLRYPTLLPLLLRELGVPLWHPTPPVRRAAICAVVSRIRHELQFLSMSMAMVMVAATLLMVLLMKITTTLVEHDVKHDLIVDSRRRLEQEGR